MELGLGQRFNDSILLGLLYEIRPWQWYKQSMLLLGIVFSENLLSSDAWANVILATVSFCAVAGATYIYNDISDVEEDRNHPTKQNRPIASGQVPISVAAGFGLLLFFGGIAVASTVNLLYLGIVLVYLIQNALYSLVLKDIPLVDILVIAIGFVLRAIGGVVAISVFLSPWLVLCTFLTALLLAIGKRRHELRVSPTPAETRATLTEYTEESLDQLLLVTLSTLLVSYSLYTFFRASHLMMLTLPFAFFGVFRYHHLVQTADFGGDPVRLITDRQFVVNLVLWTGTTLTVLYASNEIISLLTNLL